MKGMALKSLLIVGALGLSGGLFAQQSVRMGELEVSKIWQEYGTVFVQDSVMELQARSVAKIRLDGETDCFSARISLCGQEAGWDDSEMVV